MNDQSPRTEPIALVGAYERDNFGDLLFLELTRSLLGSRRSVATAPISADVSALGPTPGDIQEYWTLFANGGAGAIWVVGGEVGGTSMESALHMAGGSAPQAWLRRRASPYLPRPSALGPTAGIPLIINSAGLAGVNGLKGSRLVEVTAALREADFISVRDMKSSLVLDSHDIPHDVAPDLVQAISLLAPALASPDTEPPYAVFQIKEKWARRAGIDAVASAILASALGDVGRLVLMPAGLAPGHDSFASYSQIRDRIHAAAPGLHVSHFDGVGPFAKAALVAHAALFVGTSLHGHIIASAFGVPRVSLLLQKVRTYAQSWDDASPTMVGLEDLARATRTALRTGGTASDRERGERMAELASTNGRLALSALESGSSVADRRRARELSARRVSRDLASPRARLADLASDVGGRLRRRFTS